MCLYDDLTCVDIDDEGPKGGFRDGSLLFELAIRSCMFPKRRFAGKNVFVWAKRLLKRDKFRTILDLGHKGES